MIVVIDTSSLMALVRYYLPFDNGNALKDFFKKKVENKEIIILDKVANESKYTAKGLIVKSLDFIEDRNNQYKTEFLLPEPSFLRDLENRLCYAARKNTLTSVEFENRKQFFLESADAKLILYCLMSKGEDSLLPEKLLLVTEESKTNNDFKVFKKLPEIAELLSIETCSLPSLFNDFYNLKLSGYLK